MILAFAYAAVAAAFSVSVSAATAQFRTTTDAATLLYDAPSVKSKRLFVLSRDYPLEIIVNLDAWLKVRDATGAIAWVEKKATSERRVALVRSAIAEVLAAPDANAAVVFKAEQNVVLELEPPPNAPATPGWARVRHRDGQAGWVRVQQLWGV